MKITEQTWFPLSMVMVLICSVGSGAWAASGYVERLKSIEDRDSIIMSKLEKIEESITDLKIEIKKGRR